jgi:hypothetical protein
MSSSTSVVAAAEISTSTPRGATIDVFFQLWRWLLTDILPAPPRGPP